MKVTLLAAVVFLVYVMSGLTDASGGSEAKGPVVTHVVEFEVSREGENLGTIQIGLFGKTVPKTAENFFQLANQVQPEGYQGSKFHRVIANFMLQGGDFTRGDGRDNLHFLISAPKRAHIKSKIFIYLFKSSYLKKYII